MTVYIGADHRGFALKQSLSAWFQEKGYKIIDCGFATADPEDNYPEVAFAVSKHVLKDSGSRGILLCGTGAGMSIGANRMKGIRAILGFDPSQVAKSRVEDDVNILVMPADMIAADLAISLTETFLNTEFDEVAKHRRRIELLDK